MGLFLRYKGFSFTEIGVITFVFMISSLLTEIPTGYFADKFGRRNSILAGLLLLCIMAPLWTQGYLLIHYIIMSVIWMLALAFLSGSFEAYIYDHLKRNNLLAHYDGVISKSTMLMFVASALGMIIGTSTFVLNPNLPYIVLMGTSLVSFFIVLFMENDSVYIAKSTLSDDFHIFSGLSYIIKSPSLLWITAFIALFFSYYHFFIEGTNLPYLVSLNTISLLQIGVFLAGMSILQAIFAAKFELLRKKFSDSQLIICLIGMQFFSLVGLSLLFGILGLFAYLAFSLIEPLEPLLINGFAQKFVKSSIRATTISSIKLVSSVVFSVVAILAGFLTDQVGLRSSFLYIAVTFAIVFVILLIAKVKAKIVV
jgi:MFS family permease